MLWRDRQEQIPSEMAASLLELAVCCGSKRNRNMGKVSFRDIVHYGSLLRSEKSLPQAFLPRLLGYVLLRRLWLSKLEVSGFGCQ